MTIDTEIKALAAHIMKTAMSEGSDVTFEEKTEALKTATALYAILLKHEGKGGSPDDEPGFDQFAKTLEAVEEPNGATKSKVRGRRGAGPEH